jgi:hypothetical protein
MHKAEIKDVFLNQNPSKQVLMLAIKSKYIKVRKWIASNYHKVTKDIRNSDLR